MQAESNRLESEKIFRGFSKEGEVFDQSQKYSQLKNDDQSLTG